MDTDVRLGLQSGPCAILASSPIVFRLILPCKRDTTKSRVAKCETTLNVVPACTPTASCTQSV
jgi:hypothetical protein